MTDSGVDLARLALEQQVHAIGHEGAALRGSSSDSRPSDVEAFLGGVVLIKIEKLAGSSEKSAGVALQALPFDAAQLTALKVLRLAGEGVLSHAVVSSLLHTSLREIDLPGQKLNTEQLVSLFGSASSACSPRLPALTALRLRKNALETFPPEVLSQLPRLSELDLSENALTHAPSELFELCPALRSLNLERNGRLTVRGLDFRGCSLETLLLGLSRIDYIPNLGTITSLTDLSLFSLHIHARVSRRDPCDHFEALPVHAEILRLNAQVRVNTCKSL